MPDDAAAGPARETPAGPVPGPPPRSLKRLAIRGSVWTFIGYGVAQVIRLGGNLVLTRLLFPEAFGVMALVNVFLQGLAMFSDLGLAPSIVQSPRGEDPGYLRTAWTIQVIRGIALWCGALAVSFPAARFYDEPALARFLPVAGFTLLFAGLESTNFHLLQRHLNVVMQTVLSIGLQVVGLTVSMAGALVWRAGVEVRNIEGILRVVSEASPGAGDMLDPSYLWGGIWALIIGTLTARALQTVVTHLLPGPRMGFTFDKQHAHEMIHFGKWIFLATLFSFLVHYCDRLVLAKFMDSARLGVYSIGMMFPLAMLEVLRGIGSRVLFPVYAELARERPENLRSRMLRARFLLACVTLPVLWVMVILGPEIIDVFYDERYSEAGIFVQLLAGGTVFTALTAPVGNILLSVGNSFRHFLVLLGRSVLFLGAVAVGGYFYGTYGIILGVVIAPALNYPILAGLTRKYGAWTPGFDAACIAVSVAVVLAGLAMKSAIL